MPDDKTKQIIPDMSEFEIDDVVSILMGSTPDSEIHIEYEDEVPEEKLSTRVHMCNWGLVLDKDVTATIISFIKASRLWVGILPAGSGE